ncbi:protein of unknown function [Methylorubrum extorquens]|uniref:Uncharacterized protein n=1 Tax=Methylorubrum extorquens TaxID=408 RepID=A0A2N9AME5_METEX|nr:protein of unknown function [Methylorubrum extorquens]
MAEVRKRMRAPWLGRASVSYDRYMQERRQRRLRIEAAASRTIEDRL